MDVFKLKVMCLGYRVYKNFEENEDEKGKIEMIKVLEEKMG